MVDLIFADAKGAQPAVVLGFRAMARHPRQSSGLRHLPVALMVDLIFADAKGAQPAVVLGFRAMARHPRQ
jgi:hypothetical protein